MSDLSDKQLKWGYWYFLHRELIRRCMIVVVVVMISSIWIYGGWQLVDWYSTRDAEEEGLQVLTRSAINLDFHQRNAPLPLEIKLATAVPSGAGQYDLVGQVKNPNLKWAVSQFTYSFEVSGQNIIGTSFLLPIDDTFVVSTGVPIAVPPQKIELAIIDVKWRRIRDFKDFLVPSFEVSDEKIESLSTLTGGSSRGTRLRFLLNNSNPYNFYKVPLVVVLTYQSSVQAVLQQTLDNFISNESRVVEFIIPNENIRVDNLLIKTQVNVLDRSVFKPL